MIKSLYIENYALIKSLRFEPGSNFNIITGETGAGKSILLDCLHLALGQRAELKAIRSGSKKCIVELEVDLEEMQLNTFFENNDLDFENSTIIRRELHNSGKTRSFVNDTPVAIQVLKDLGTLLIDIHSQNEHSLLLNPIEQLDFLDEVANNKMIKESYQSLYKDYKKIKNQLAEKEDAFEKLKEEESYFQFLLKELEEFKPQISDDGLEDAIKQIAEKEDVQNQISAFQDAINNDHYGLGTILKPILHALQKMNGSEDLNKANERLASVVYELEDLQYAYQDIVDHLMNQNQSQEELTARFDMFNRLLQKHQVNNADELVLIWEEVADKVQKTTNSESLIIELKQRMDSLEKQMSTLATKLDANRRKAKPILQQYTVDQLKKLGMPDAVLDIELTKTPDFQPSGQNKIQFLFSANKGQVRQNLKKVASGGELSRLMLVLKAKLAQYKKLPTLIFDEIDTGVSGEIASKMANVMADLGRGHQIISITHLPQVASKGDEHFFVSKSTKGAETFSTINKLTEEQKIHALAEMLSGHSVTPASIEKAKELLKE